MRKLAEWAVSLLQTNGPPSAQNNQVGTNSSLLQTSGFGLAAQIRWLRLQLERGLSRSTLLGVSTWRADYCHHRYGG